MTKKFNKKNFNSFKGKVNKEEAFELLSIVRRNKEDSIFDEKRAIVWAVENTPLIMEEIAEVLGYSAKSYIHKLYHENKGGEK